MKRMDPRLLSPNAQEDLRRRVVYSMRVDKRSATQAAALHGVTRQSASKWKRAAEAGGSAALKSRRRGPQAGPRLKGADEKQLRRAIRDDCPDQLRLPFALWTRQAVVELIRQRSGRVVSIWTAGRYLKRWGFTPQKPLRRAYQRNEAAVRAWLKSDYPGIQQRAKREKALILWGDEMGLRSDDPVGRSYAPRGCTPVVAAAGTRFGCSMISALSNRGMLRFKVFRGRFVVDVFIDFLARLLQNTGNPKLFLIVDSHPVHKASKVKTWLNDPQRAGRLSLFHLPGYSPELNPDECVNQDTKQAMRKRRPPRNVDEMISNVRQHLRRRQRQPKVIQSFFQEKHVRYAA
jgi:transposase